MHLFKAQAGEFRTSLDASSSTALAAPSHTLLASSWIFHGSCMHATKGSLSRKGHLIGVGHAMRVSIEGWERMSLMGARTDGRTDGGRRRPVNHAKKVSALPEIADSRDGSIMNVSCKGIGKRTTGRPLPGKFPAKVAHCYYKVL